MSLIFNVVRADMNHIPVNTLLGYITVSTKSAAPLARPCDCFPVEADVKEPGWARSIMVTMLENHLKLCRMTGLNGRWKQAGAAREE